MKKFSILIVTVLLILTGCGTKDNSKKITIITTNFPSYDLARAITKNSDIEVKMLIKPGEELHHFEPSPKDIININESSLFIYIGGESDEWVKKILNSLNKNLKKLKLIDFVSLQKEEIVEGMEQEEDEHEEEYDEHIWTSPINNMKLLEVIKNEIIKIDPNNRKLYEKNYLEYHNEIKNIDKEIREVVKDGKRNLLIFGDRFPMTYFVKEYNLQYYAAFPGCSHENEASSKTIAFLIDKVKEKKIPVILYMELSNKKIAEIIAKDTNVKTREFHSAHNVTNEDFINNITYVEIMKKNINVLKEALS